VRRRIGRAGLCRRLVLASDGCAKDQAEALVGDPGLVEALTGWGMAHVQPHSPADPAWFRPASPDLALQGVLAGHQNQLARDQERLLDGHRRQADAQSKFGIGMNGRFPAHLVSVVSDRAEISELSAALMNTARKDWMTLETLDTEMPLTGDFAQPPLPALGGAVRCRSIYAASAMDDPAARRIIETCTEAGEQARLLAAVPMKLKLADHTTAMLPLTPTSPAALPPVPGLRAVSGVSTSLGSKPASRSGSWPGQPGAWALLPTPCPAGDSTVPRLR
jgi:hypothetical protein